MSQENVELVLALYPASDVDFVQLFGDDSLWAEQAEAMAPFVHTDLERVWVSRLCLLPAGRPNPCLPRGLIVNCL